MIERKYFCNICKENYSDEYLLGFSMDGPLGGRMGTELWRYEIHLCKNCIPNLTVALKKLEEREARDEAPNFPD